MKKISIMFLSLLMILALVGCSRSSSDTNESDNTVSENEQQEENSEVEESSLSGEAPRTNTPMFPGAELVKEVKYSVAVEEVYATDEAVMDVIAFYGEYSQFKPILEIKNPPPNEEGIYYETPLMKLLKGGDSLQEEINNSGTLLCLLIAPSDGDSNIGILGSKVVEELPENKTIISLRILTEY